MIKLYRKTLAGRATCRQSARVMLEPEPSDAPPGSVRRVQVLVPPSPKCYLTLDETPESLGPNRTYKMPVASPGAALVFHLLPEQFLVGASHEGNAEFSIIVEYIEDM